MTTYTNSIDAKAGVATTIGDNVSVTNSITPTTHAALLDDLVDTEFRFSAGATEATIRTSLLDATLTFLQIPDGTYTASAGTLKIERDANSEWRRIDGLGNAIIAKTNATSSTCLDLQNESGTGDAGKIFISNLTLEGMATVDPDDFDGSSSGLFIGNNTSSFERVDDVKLFHVTIRNQSSLAVQNHKGGDNYEFFHNRIENIGRGGYVVSGSQFGMFCFNRSDNTGDDGIAMNASSSWNVVIGNIQKRASGDYTDNSGYALKINGYGAVCIGNISYQSRGHIAPRNRNTYENNANQTYACQHSIFAFNVGHGLDAQDELVQNDQFGYECQGNLNLFLGNVNNTVQAVDRGDETLGDSIGTCHPIIKIKECGRVDYAHEIFEGGQVKVTGTKSRDVRFFRCKFFNWQGQDNDDWYDVQAIQVNSGRKIHRLDLVQCEFDNAIGCIVRMLGNARINQLNVIDCEELMFNNVAELAGDEDSVTTIEINDVVTQLDISRAAIDWKGWRARWSTDQTFYLCTYNADMNIVYDVVTLAEPVYPNMGSGTSHTISVDSFTATNQYVHKDSWLALKKRTAIDGTRGIVHLGTGAEIDVLNVKDQTHLGVNKSLSGYVTSSGGSVTTTYLNGSVHTEGDPVA